MDVLKKPQKICKGTPKTPEPANPAVRVYQFDSFVLDQTERILLRGRTPVPLPPKVFDILSVLVENAGHLLTKATLMEKVWPDTFVEEANVSINIAILRKSLGQSASGQVYIETVRKRGYRFVATVLEVESESALRILRHEQRSLVTPCESKLGLSQDFNSLAVLPFANESGDPDSEYLSDGLTESIINSFSHLQDFRVLARNTVFRYKAKSADPQEIGEQLGVRSVVTGRILRLGDQVIIRAEVVDVKSGWQIWGEQYHRKLSDLLMVQEEIAEEISNKLRLRLSAEMSEQLRLTLTSEEKCALTRRHTDSPEAYDLYLRGRYFWNKRNAEGARKAIEFFERAAYTDPDYALAYAGLADAYHLLCGLGILAPREGHPKAKEAARTALAKDENLPEAHASLGIIGLRYDWDWPTAERELKRAIALNPSYALARHWYAIYLSARTRFDEAIAECKRALRLDPLSLIINTLLGTHYFFAGRYDEAIAQLRQTLELDPDFIIAHAALAECNCYAGNHAEAVAEIERASELVGWNTAQALGARGYIYAAVGRVADARALLDELERRAAGEFISAFEIGRIYVHLGEMEKALSWLNAACDQRDGDLLHVLSLPELSPLRSHPGFGKVVRRVGITP